VSPGLTPAGAAGQFRLEGAAGFGQARTLLAAGERLFAGWPAVSVDLAGVTQVDSATLALLLEWRRLAARRGHAVTYTGLPARLVALARLSGVAGLIGAADAAPGRGQGAGTASSP
jgi:phospholipid transport system transporter-binding protein